MMCHTSTLSVFCIICGVSFVIFSQSQAEESLSDKNIHVSETEEKPDSSSKPNSVDQKFSKLPAIRNRRNIFSDKDDYFNFPDEDGTLGSAFQYNNHIIRNLIQSQSSKPMNYARSKFFLNLLRPLSRRTTRYNWDGHSVMHFGKRSVPVKSPENVSDDQEYLIHHPSDTEADSTFTYSGSNLDDLDYSEKSEDANNDETMNWNLSEDQMPKEKRSNPYGDHSTMHFGKRGEEPWHNVMSFGKRPESRWEDHNTMHFGKREDPWHSMMSFGKKSENLWNDHNTMHFGKREQPWHNMMSFGKKSENSWDDHNTMHFGKREDPWHNVMSFGKKSEKTWDDHNTMHFGKRDDPWHNVMSFGKKSENSWDDHNTMHFGKREDPWHNVMSFGKKSENSWDDHNTMHFGKREEPWHNMMSFGKKSENSWNDHNTMHFGKREEPWHHVMSFGKKSENPWDDHNTMHFGKREEPWHSMMSFGKKSETPWGDHSTLHFGKRDDLWHSKMSFGKKSDNPWSDHNTMHFGKRDDPWHNVMSFGKKSDSSSSEPNAAYFEKRSEPWHNMMSFGKRTENPWHSMINFGKKSENPWSEHNTMHFGKKSDTWDNAVSSAETDSLENERDTGQKLFANLEDLNSEKSQSSLNAESEPEIMQYENPQTTSLNIKKRSITSLDNENTPEYASKTNDVLAKRADGWHNHNTLHFGKKSIESTDKYDDKKYDPWNNHNTMHFGKKSDSWNSHNTLHFGKKSKMQNTENSVGFNRNLIPLEQSIATKIMLSPDNVDSKTNKNDKPKMHSDNNLISLKKRSTNKISNLPNAAMSSKDKKLLKYSSGTKHSKMPSITRKDKQTPAPDDVKKEIKNNTLRELTNNSETHAHKSKRSADILPVEMNNLNEVNDNHKSSENSGQDLSKDAVLHFGKRSINEEPDDGNEIESQMDKKSGNGWDHNTLHFGKKSDPWSSHNTMHFGKKSAPWESHNTMHFGKKSNPWDSHNTLHFGKKSEPFESFKMHFGKKSDPWESHGTMHFGKKSDPWESHGTMHFGKKADPWELHNTMHFGKKADPWQSHTMHFGKKADPWELHNTMHFGKKSEPIRSQTDYSSKSNEENQANDISSILKNVNIDQNTIPNNTQDPDEKKILLQILLSHLRPNTDDSKLVENQLQTNDEDSLNQFIGFLSQLEDQTQKNYIHNDNEDRFLTILKKLRDNILNYSGRERENKDLIDLLEQIELNVDASLDVENENSTVLTANLAKLPGDSILLKQNVEKRYWVPFQGAKSMVYPHAWLASQIRRSGIPKSTRSFEMRMAEKKEDPVNSFMHFGRR